MKDTQKKQTLKKYASNKPIIKIKKKSKNGEKEINMNFKKQIQT